MLFSLAHAPRHTGHSNALANLRRCSPRCGIRGRRDRAERERVQRRTPRGPHAGMQPRERRRTNSRNAMTVSFSDLRAVTRQSLAMEADLLTGDRKVNRSCGSSAGSRLGRSYSTLCYPGAPPWKNPPTRPTCSPDASGPTTFSFLSCFFCSDNVLRTRSRGIGGRSQTLYSLR